MTTLTKQEAGRIGGLATLARHGRAHFAIIGKRGAAITWQRYTLRPVGSSDFALVARDTGEIKAYLSGLPFQEVRT
jgi:hypothetical protein